MTNRERVLDLIRSEPGLTDRQIREHTCIQPHQQVNQICRLLVAEGLVERLPGPDGRLRNHPTGGAEAQRQLARTVSESPPAHRLGTRHRSRNGVRTSLPSLAVGQTLFVIPCSGAKRQGHSGHSGQSIMEELPEPLAAELASRRRRNAAIAQVDDTRRSAIDRYSGTLFTSAGSALSSIEEQGARLVILSGGYGLVLAEEPIGWYDCRFQPGMWPNRLVERCLSSLAQESGMRRVVGLVAGSTSYATVFRRTRWPQHVDIFLLTPESVTGAMVKAPRAQGEALAEISTRGSLPGEWRSSDGLRMEVTRL